MGKPLDALLKGSRSLLLIPPKGIVPLFPKKGVADGALIYIIGEYVNEQKVIT